MISFRSLVHVALIPLLSFQAHSDIDFDLRLPSCSGIFQRISYLTQSGIKARDDQNQGGDRDQLLQKRRAEAEKRLKEVAANEETQLSKMKVINLVQYNIENLTQKVRNKKGDRFADSDTPRDFPRWKQTLMKVAESFHFSLRKVSMTLRGNARGAEFKQPWRIDYATASLMEQFPHWFTMEEILETNDHPNQLELLNKKQMGSVFKTFWKRGNDGRGIQIGFGHRLPIDIDFESHKDETWTDPMDGRTKLLFSRDLPVLIAYPKNEGPVNKKVPYAIFIGTHYKSKIDRDGDPESQILRHAQMERSAEIVKELMARFGKDVPIFFSGDFNADMENDPEPTLLYNLGLVDSLEHFGTRDYTQSYFPNGGSPKYSQFDAILTNRPDLLISSEVVPYVDWNGSVVPKPTSYDERNSTQPSDHRIVKAEVDAQKLWQSYQERLQKADGQKLN